MLEPVSLSPMQDFSLEEALHRVLESAHCLLWRATIRRAPACSPEQLRRAESQGTLESGTYFAWDVRLLAEAAAQRWLPVAPIPGQDYSEALYQAIVPEDREESDRRSARALEQGQQTYTQELRLQTLSGELRWMQEQVSLTPCGADLWSAVGVSVDITAIKSSEQALLHRANHDSLTNLPNRYHFIQILSEQTTERSVVLFVDIDNFKLINDQFGHPIGDGVLAAVAERLQHEVGSAGLVARLGGDEFTIFFPTAPPAHELTQRAEALCQSLSQPISLPGRTITLSSSIGIAQGPVSAPLNLIRNASTALRQAKHQGKAGYCHFTPEMEALHRERFRMEIALRQALKSGEGIIAHYQPVFSMQTRALVGLEALARWQLSAGVECPPTRFIPLAEETGLILPLGLVLLRQVCLQGLHWHQKLARKEFQLNVNVSERQLRHPDFVWQLRQVLRETDFPPHALTLELTESLLFEDTENTIRTLEVLNQLGVRLVLDDFGTGFSSLSYLTRLPVSGIKIAQVFVGALSSPDPTVASQNRAIVRSLCALAASLTLEVTAEGIENEEQWSYLKQLGVHYGQGYLLSRPLSPEHLEEHLWSGVFKL